MAEITTRSLKNDRTVLRDVVPIDTPFLLGIFVGDICNFKCKYCIQSADDSVNEKKQLVKSFLDWDTFVTIVDSAKKFPQKIKTVLLTSIGEPLLQPNIVRMIQYMKDVDLADAYEIVTNASVLTPELSRGLIDAGLTRLCISLQGLTAEKYKEVCGVKIDYANFYNNIQYFYEYSRGKCRVHIKTVDLALDEGEESKFYEMYGSICDTIYLDKVSPVFKGVDYTGMIADNEKYTQEKYKACEGVACSSLFYTLYTLADGRIVPCCDHPQPMIYGNIADMSLVDAWNSEVRKKFLTQHLKHKRCDNEICAQCSAPLDREFESDRLDGAEELILNRMERGEYH